MRRLTNQVRPYDWGSTTAIPRLLGTEPDGRPQAELWLGAHPGAPSLLRVEEGRPVGLDAAIEESPEPLLGQRAVRDFGPRLPFLLKLLAAEAPLSLQAHPGPARAQAGFAAEEAAGIARDARERNYRDPYHKPEMVVALEPFDALCGFRDPASAAADLAGNGSPLARELRADLENTDAAVALRAALTRLLTLAGSERAELVNELVAVERTREGGPDPKGNTRCLLDLAERYPGDPGAVGALLLNQVRLRPGQALFLPAGNVHAYLRGTAVEIMASSDNVLRAGLTSKHVDAGELLEVVRFEVLPPPWVDPVRDGGWLRYPVPVPDFALSIGEPGAGEPVLPGEVPGIVLALGEGTATLRAASGEELTLRGGESAFVAAADGAVTAANRSGDSLRLVVASTG